MTARNQAPDSNLKLPKATEAKLAGGLRVLMIDIPNCPAMQFNLGFRAGDYLCPDNKPDLAHFLEHIVLGANAEYPTEADFARALNAKGGFRNAYTGPYNLVYWFDAPDFDFERMLDLILLGVSQPLFLPEEFASEREVIRQEFVRRVSNRPLMAYDRAKIATGFAGVRETERLKRIDAIELGDLSDYYRRTHKLDNARVLVAGHLPSSRRRRLRHRLERLALPTNSADRPALPPEKLRPAGLIYQHDPQSEAVNYYLMLVDSRQRLTQLERDALGVLSVLLFDGAHSRIYGRGRQQGLIYSIGGGFGTTLNSGYCHLSGQVSADNLEPLIDLIQTEIARILAGDLPEEEVDRIKVELQGDFYRTRIGPSSWIGHYKGQYFEDDLVIPPDLNARLELVTRDEVLRVASRVLSPNRWTLSLLGRVSPASRRRLKVRLDRGWGAEK